MAMVTGESDSSVGVLRDCIGRGVAEMGGAEPVLRIEVSLRFEMYVNTTSLATPSLPILLRPEASFSQLASVPLFHILYIASGAAVLQINVIQNIVGNFQTEHCSLVSSMESFSRALTTSSVDSYVEAAMTSDIKSDRVEWSSYVHVH